MTDELEKKGINPSQLLAVSEIAQLLRCSQKHVRQEIENGRLRKVRIGRLVRVSQVELNRYIEERTSN